MCECELLIQLRTTVIYLTGYGLHLSAAPSLPPSFHLLFFLSLFPSNFSYFHSPILNPSNMFYHYHIYLYLPLLNELLSWLPHDVTEGST